MSFFYRELLSVGLVAMSAWAFTSVNRCNHPVSFLMMSFTVSINIRCSLLGTFVNSLYILLSAVGWATRRVSSQ